jgi:hypothetical protein
MFCPKCGQEDPKSSQFCRACGTELQVVRTALERPDAITTSAITAREEIGLAIASKIKEFESSHDLRRAVYELLPAIERFLESPEEKRLHSQERRLQHIREGVLTSAVGLAVALLFMVLKSYKVTVDYADILVIASLVGLAILVIGLGIVINGLFFTTLKSTSGKRSSHGTPDELDELVGGLATKDLLQRPQASTQPSGLPSVTEGTTRELDSRTQ